MSKANISRVKMFTIPYWILDMGLSADALATIMVAHRPGFDISNVRENLKLSDFEFEEAISELERSGLLERDEEVYSFKLK